MGYRRPSTMLCIGRMGRWQTEDYYLLSYSSRFSYSNDSHGLNEYLFSGAQDAFALDFSAPPPSRTHTHININSNVNAEWEVRIAVHTTRTKLKGRETQREKLYKMIIISRAYTVVERG